jgi:hypothetical protein
MLMPQVYRLIQLMLTWCACAEECCLNAIRTEAIERRLHWLEAAARWVSLARHQGFLLPAQDKAAPSSDPA